MERLTEYNDLAGVKTGNLKAGVDERKAFDRLAAFEDIGLEPAQIARRLLPCAPGDWLYVDYGFMIPAEFRVFDIHATENGMILYAVNIHTMRVMQFDAALLGKTIFLTREEASMYLHKKPKKNSDIG